MDAKENKKVTVDTSATFAEQVDAVLNGNYPKGETVLVKDETPFALRQVGLRNLPMLTTQKHLSDALHAKSEDNPHWHGLSLSVLKGLPNYFENPVMIMDSMSNSGSIVVVTDKFDNDNLPIIASIRPDGTGLYNKIKIESNFVTGYYGKKNFGNFLEKNLSNNTVLYWDKEKSLNLLGAIRLQLPQVLTSLDSDTIIRKSRAFVNSQDKKNSDKKHYRALPEELNENTNKKQEGYMENRKPTLKERFQAFFRKKENGNSDLNHYREFPQPKNESDLISEARERAKLLAQETGEPFVTIYNSENSAFSAGDVLSLSEADKRLTELNAYHSDIGYDKTRLSIDCVFKGKLESYDRCRFDIGDENGGLVDRIASYWNYYNIQEPSAEHQEMVNFAKYLKTHLTLANMVDNAIKAKLPLQEQYDVQGYVLHTCHELNASQTPESFEMPILDIEHKEEVMASVAGSNEHYHAFPEPSAHSEAAKADDGSASTQTSYRDKVFKIRDQMVQTLIGYIEQNPTEWESGWNNLAGTAPENGKTGAAYRGINSLYLALTSMSKGYKDPRWVTFNQAKELGASVMKGEKSVPIIFFELYDRATKKAYDSRTVKNMTEDEKAAYLKENVYAVMKYSSVFNAAQCQNFPERDVESLKMSEEEQANQNELIDTIIINSAAPVKYDGGNRAYYSPDSDTIHVPPLEAFTSMQDYYATVLHEIAHSTGHESRLNRDLSGHMGSESYAKEELRAELACVFMQLEQGLKIDGKHITNHAAYLNSWLKAAKDDPKVFYEAARDAERISDYVAENYLQSVNADELELEDENVNQIEGEHEEKDALSQSVKEWYQATYPTDELGKVIPENTTFKTLQDTLNKHGDVYAILAQDSVVRERAFARLAELTNSTYDSIYRAWSGESLEDKREREMAVAREDYPNDFEDDFTEALLDHFESKQNAQDTENITGEHKEEMTSVPHYSIDFKLDYSNDMLLSNEMKRLGFKKDMAAVERNHQRDGAAIGNTDRWEDEINYIGPDGKTIEGVYGKTFNGIMMESTVITGFTTSGLDAKEVQAVADVIRDFGVDVTVKEIASARLPQEQEKGEHKEEVEKALPNEQRTAQPPLIINFFAGPGAGKTTAAHELTAALKKVGYNVEYVGEYAKELVLENKLDILDNQEHVTDEQYHRLDRLRNSGVEIVVTDSPVLLGKIYGEGKISPEYQNQIMEYYKSFDNFNLVVKRGETYQTEGRLETFEQAKAIDNKITDLLRSNKLFYGNYHHDEIGKTVDRINTTFKRLYGEKQMGEHKEKSSDEIHVSTAVNTFCTDFGGEYTYFVANNGLSIDDICTAYAERPYDGFGYQFGTPIKAELYEKIQNEGKGFNIDFLDDINAFSITQDGKVIDSGYLYEDLIKKYQERDARAEETAERTIGEELANKSTWLKIDLPDAAVGKEYGKTTLVKMPQDGEYSYFGIYVPTRFLKQLAGGKWQLTVGDKLSYRLNNDGRQVELTGKELLESFAGNEIGKQPIRVAPSKRNAESLARLEKNIPAEMKSIPNWCVYRTKLNEEKGKRDKYILSPLDGKWAKSNEPQRWTDFDTAMKYAKENGCEGLSFVLDGKTGITCIDLDKCIDADGKYNDVASKLTAELKGTFMEKSVSGNGVHIFLKDDVLKNGKYKSTAITTGGELEVYDTGHMISMTGDIISETNVLGKCPTSTTDFLRRTLGEKPNFNSRPNYSSARSGYQAGNDREVVARIQKSKRGAEFDALYSGHGVTGNASIDDMKLANMLAFFTDGDKEQCMRIMRGASIYRPDKPDSYYQHTIQKAVDTLSARPKYGAAQGASASRSNANGADGAAH